MEKILEDLIKLRHTKIVEKPSIFEAGYFFDFHKDSLLIEYSQTGDIEAFLEGLTKLFHPNYAVKEIPVKEEYLYIPPAYLGYDDLAKFLDKELSKLGLTEKFKEDIVNHLVNLQNNSGLYTIEETLTTPFESRTVRNRLSVYLKKKGNILSENLAPKEVFDKEILKKNIYAMLVYEFTKSIEKVKYGDFSDIPEAIEEADKFLLNLQSEDELTEFVKKHNFKDKTTLQNWKQITNPWEILEKGLASRDPLIFMNPKDVQQQAEIPCYVLRVMGYDIKPSDISKWHKKELTSWYKKHNIKSVEDLEEALKKEYACITTMSPEQINGYIETVPLLKKKLANVKGYYLLIPHKDANRKLIVKKVITIREAQEYMKSKFRYECEEIVAKPVTETFGQIHILASYNTKNRDEYFGYLVNQDCATNYSSPIDLFVNMMTELSTLSKEDMHESKDWQVASVGKFVWCVHSREFKYHIPEAVLYECKNGLLNTLEDFINKKLAYTRYLVVADDMSYIEIVHSTNIANIFLRFENLESLATTGTKGISARGVHKRLGYINLIALGLTDTEFQQVQNLGQYKLMASAEKMLAKCNWAMLNGRMPDMAENRPVLQLSRLTEDQTTGNYLTTTTVLNNNRKNWVCNFLRKDNKQMIVDVPKGQRNYVILTKEEYNWILKYMGVQTPKEIDWKILRKKCQFFYENMGIYRELERMAHHDI